MTTILTLVTDHLGPILIALGAIIGAILARKSGADAQKAKQAAKERDAYEKHLKDIAAAADARNRVDPAGVSVDPNNRDNKR